MSERDRQFLAYYREHRIKDQHEYYESKAAWHRGRADLLIVLVGLVMLATSVVALAASLGGGGRGWAVAAAVLPTVAAALASVRSLYEFERNSSRFEATAWDLERVAAATEPEGGLEGEALRASIARQVAEVENLLSRENRQWVEFMSAVKLPSPQE